MIPNCQKKILMKIHYKLGTACILILKLKPLTLPKTNSSPLKIGRAPKGNDRIPTIHFQVLLLLVSGRVLNMKNLNSNETCQPAKLHMWITRSPDYWHDEFKTLGWHSIESWLVYRDPYIGFIIFPISLGSISSPISNNQPGFDCLLHPNRLPKSSESLIFVRFRVLSLAFWEGTWFVDIYIYTLPETNIAPENGPSQKETSLPILFIHIYYIYWSLFWGASTLQDSPNLSGSFGLLFSSSPGCAGDDPGWPISVFRLREHLA